MFTTLIKVYGSMLFFAVLFGAEVPEAIGAINTYKGQEITLDNIRELMPVRLSQERKTNLKNFDSRNGGILQTLSCNPDEHVSQWKKRDMSCFKVTYYGGRNYTIQPSDDTIIKISSPEARRENIRAGYSVNDNNQDRTTYQTISHAANYLRVTEAIEIFDLKHISVPPTYLMRVPGRSKKCCDQNYVVVQDYITGLKSTGKDFQEAFQKFSDSIVPELFTMTKYVALPDVFTVDRNSRPANMAMDNDKIMIFDLEQSWEIPPSDFFRKSPDEWEADLIGSLACLSIATERLGTTNQYSQLTDLIKHDTLVSKFTEKIAKYCQKFRDVYQF